MSRADRDAQVSAAIRGLSWWIAAMGVTAVAACGGGGGGGQPAGTAVADVVVSRSNLFLTAPGQSASLAARTVDAQGQSLSGPVTWTSSAPDQVAVDANGTVTAKAIGSATIVAASGGVTSLPTFVVVAEPKPGALLLSDAQVLSVGTPLDLPAGAYPGIGTQYEVRVASVSPAPAAGTVVLALGDAPVEGTVVSTRDDGGALVLTLQLAPLQELLARYHIDLAFDVGQFDDPSLAPASAATGWPEWPARAARAGVVRHDTKDIVQEFHAFACDPSFKAQILKQDVSLTEKGTMSYEVKDYRDDPTLPAGYVLRRLFGTLTAQGKASIALTPGFTGTLECLAQKPIYVKCFGWFSFIMMPAFRYGLGAKLTGTLVVAPAELSITGTVGLSYNVGWECIPPAPCAGIGDLTPVQEVKPIATAPDTSAMRLQLSGQLYGLAGLDAAFGAGALGHASLIEARTGPKQSFDLGFEADQANDTGYASTFDLKWDSVVEPGASLKAALKQDIDDDGVGLNFKLESESTLAESPKGSFKVDKTTAGIGETVTLTVDLDPKTVDYWKFGYDPLEIEILRRVEGGAKFEKFKCGTSLAAVACIIPVTASNQTHFVTTWKPTQEDAGLNTLAAFVKTFLSTDSDAEFGFPDLEVATNSQQQVDVPCVTPVGSASSLVPRARPMVTAAALTCQDQWTANLSSDLGPPPGGTSLVHMDASLTYKRMPGTGTVAQYQATGTLGLRFNPTDCTFVLTPSSFSYPTGNLLDYSILAVDYGQDPPTYNFAVMSAVDFTSLATCPTGDITTPVTGFPIQIASQGALVTPADTAFSGSTTGADGSVTAWSFSR